MSLTSHPRSTVVLLDTGTAGTSREIYNEDEDAKIYTERIRYLHCTFFYSYQEFLCPVEPLYFSDKKSTTVEK